MVKRLIASILLGVSLSLVPCVAPSSTVEASPVYMGTYADDGSRAYLLTSSVRIFHRYPHRFSCTVEATGDYLNYYFFERDGEPYYRNSEGYEAPVFGGDSPIAVNIFRFVVDNY